MRIRMSAFVCYILFAIGGLVRRRGIRKPIHWSLLALALCFSQSVSADDYYWISASDGNWNNPANWSSTQPPVYTVVTSYPGQNANNDVVLFFDLTGTPQVAVDLAGGDRTIDALYFEINSTTYNLVNSDNASLPPPAYQILDITGVLAGQGGTVNFSNTKITANYFTNGNASFNFVANNILTMNYGAVGGAGATMCFNASGPGFGLSANNFFVYANGTLKINTSPGGSVSANVITVASTINAGCSPGSAFIQGDIFYKPSGRSDFELDTPNVVAGGSDYFLVNGNLTLDGTINIIALPNFGIGNYRLFDYTGALTNNGVHLGTVPPGFLTLLDFSTTNQVKLVVLPPGPAVLNIALVSTNAVLSWTNAGYHLQATPTLVPAVWSNVPGTSPVTVPVLGNSQFFRLISP